MAARGGLAVSASLRWNEVRHGRAYSPPLRWGTFGGGASDAAVRRGRLIAAPTVLLSGYSLGQGLSLADGFGGQFASAKRLALHTKRPAYAGSAGGVRSTPYSLLLYSTAIWARYSYSLLSEVFLTDLLMGFSSAYRYYFHYSDRRGYLTFCCHRVARFIYNLNMLSCYLYQR